MVSEGGVVTEFGKALRIMRVCICESGWEMAARLGMGKAYLSAIENGRRPVPPGLPGRIADAYGLGEAQLHYLEDVKSGKRKAVGLADACLQTGCPEERHKG